MTTSKISLRAFGYSCNKNDSERLKAINDAVKIHGIPSVINHIENIIRNGNKHESLRNDLVFVSKLNDDDDVEEAKENIVTKEVVTTKKSIDTKTTEETITTTTTTTTVTTTIKTIKITTTN